jgi:hypothetical protein
VEALLSATARQTMEFGGGICLVGNFEDIVMKGLSVLNGAGISIVLVVKLGE